MGHTLLANAVRVPALELDPKEADALAKAAVTVMDLYPTIGMSREALAWCSLFGTMGVVYGPRLAVVRMQVAESRAARRGGSTPADAPAFAFNGA